MNPKSVAVAGASNTPTKTGSIQSLSLLKDDFQGKVYIIHPKEKSIFGIPAYPLIRTSFLWGEVYLASS